jgi:hypothetical protein
VFDSLQVLTPGLFHLLQAERKKAEAALRAYVALDPAYVDEP